MKSGWRRAPLCCVGDKFKDLEKKVVDAGLRRHDGFSRVFVWLLTVEGFG
jgi:hypothetical protein